MIDLRLQRPVVAALLIILLICLAYANSFGNGWHFDDVHTITENSHIRSLADPIGFFTERTRFARDADKAMFRPLLVLSFAINYAWTELDTVSYHVVNLAIHIGCALLLWAILQQLGRGALVALVGAVLFGLHPLATEPVNYISSRSESLTALFVLGAFLLHLHAGAREFGRWRLASVLCFGAAMLTKETGITCLALVVAIDLTRHVPEGRGLQPRYWWAARRPAHAIYLLMAIIYLGIESGHVNVAVVEQPVRDGWTQFMTQIKGLLYYARLLIVPRGLNVQHQFFEGGLPLVIGACIGVVASLLFVVAGARRDVLFGLAWCIIVLSPTLVVPLFVLVNDHRLYLSVAGFVIAVTGLLQGLPLAALRPRLFGVAGLCLILILLVQTQNRNLVWANEYTLWSDAAAKSPQPLVPVAYVHLGNYAKENGAFDEAIGYYRRALEIAPDHVAARNNLGLVLQHSGQLAAAANIFSRLTVDEPNIAEGWYNLGKTLQDQGDLDRYAKDTAAALSHYAAARHAYHQVAADTQHRDLALNNIGTTFELSARLDSAAYYYRQALVQQRSSADAGDNLQRLLRQLASNAQELIDARRFIELEGLCEQLVAVDGAPPEALFFLAVSRFSQGRFHDSLNPNQELLQRFPDFALGYLQLGNALETLGQADRAVPIYKQQLQHVPTGPLAEEARRRLQVHGVLR